MPTFQQAREFLLANRTRLRQGRGTASNGPSPCRSTGRSTGSTPSWRARPTAGDRCALWIVDVATAPGDHAHLRRAVRRAPARSPTTCAQLRREARRPRAADARQRRAAVGDHAGGDEARRRGDPGDDAARPPTISPTASSAGARAHDRGRPADRSRNSPASRELHAASRSATRATEAGSRYGDRLQRPAAFTPDGRNQRRRSAAALLHLGHDGEAQAGAAHAIAAIRSATCRRCTGSGCSRATSTSTSPRPAGPSTPGAASSRRGTPGATVLHAQPAAVQRQGAARTCSARCGSPRSARRRRCGAC